MGSLFALNFTVYRRAADDVGIAVERGKVQVRGRRGEVFLTEGQMTRVHGDVVDAPSPVGSDLDLLEQLKRAGKKIKNFFHP